MQNKIKRTLVVGPAWVGDMVMAQTLFILLAEQGETVDVLAPAWSKPLLDRMPQVSKSLMQPLGHGDLNLRSRYQLGCSLASDGYERAIVLPNSWKSALVPFFAKIPVRTGWRGEWRYGLLNDIRQLDRKKLPLMIERFMALALPENSALPTPYPKPLLKINPKEALQTAELFKLDLANKPILIICPGAEFGPAKRWPEDHYAFVANEMLAQGFQVWLFGSKNDRFVTDKINIATGNRCENLAGKTSLAQAIDLMSFGNKVITNDSGLMHIAAALEKSLVAIYGSSAPSFTPPLYDKAITVKEKLPCSPCFKRECPLEHLNCLKTLKPEKVLSALDELPDVIKT